MDEYRYKEEFIPFIDDIDRKPQLVHLHEVYIGADIIDGNPHIYLTSWYENDDAERQQNMIFFGLGSEGMDRVRRFAAAMIDIADRLEEYEG